MHRYGWQFFALIALVLMVVPWHGRTVAGATSSVYGMLTTARQGQTTSTLWLVDAQGRVVAHVAFAPQPCCEGGPDGPVGPRACCGVAGAAPIPLSPVSASARRAYYLQGATQIRFLDPSGHTGLATSVPGGPHTRIAFAVSADDGAIAVAVLNYKPDTQRPAGWVGDTVAERLYVESPIGSTHRTDIYSTTFAGYGGQGAWPIGWRGTALVLAVAPGAAQAGPANPYAANGYHVASAATGVRLAAICTNTQGFYPRQALGPAVPAGTACADMRAHTLSAQDWSGACTRFAGNWQGYAAALSPDGSWMAAVDNNATLSLLSKTGAVAPMTLHQAYPIGWIDSTHVVVSESAGATYAIVDARSGTRTAIALPAAGAGHTTVSFVGALPGGLGAPAPHGPPGSGQCAGA